VDLPTYRELLALAQRHSRSADEAADLVQDVLVIALEARKEDPARLAGSAWLAGVLRRRAAFFVRSAVRRRRREAGYTPGDGDPHALEPRADPTTLLGRLPPAARRVAILALHGLTADEIRWILQLSPGAFRQRLTTIRKALGNLAPEQRAEALALAYVRDPQRSCALQFGLIRRALKSALAKSPGLGTHDSDGHLIVIATAARVDAHTRGGRGNR
jgi:RNA polymerase sigma-70 factor (ECF subfamily)